MSSEKEEEKKESPEVQGPGKLLKQERERKGLTYEDVSQATRLRPNIIEAIEREAWDSLPSPAFVRGFLRAYAKVLSLNEDEILNAYGRGVSVDADLFNVPKEHFRPKSSGSSFLLWMLAAVIALFVLWKMYAPVDTARTVQREVTPPARQETEKAAPAGVTVPAVSQEDTATNGGAGTIPGTAPAGGTEVAASGAPAKVQDKPAAEPEALAPETASKRGPQVLKAKVSARTWVKIYIDDLQPREYMFQPGQQPEWSGSKGFYLIIGNAGGIALELNGETVPGPGSSGQVVRLSLPKGFRHKVEGN